MKTISMLGLTKKELVALKKLSTPIKIQDFLDEIPMNWDDTGRYLSPRQVLAERKAHCIEGALFAAAALWVNGETPWVMDMLAAPGDQDHVLALYTRNDYWGAISKTNHATIRYRDPVYKTPRELAMSYFHEWFENARGVKTLRSYSAPYDLRRLGEGWVTAEDGLPDLDRALDRIRHYPIAPARNLKLLRRADPMELKSGRLTEWKEK